MRSPALKLAGMLGGMLLGNSMVGRADPSGRRRDTKQAPQRQCKPPTLDLRCTSVTFRNNDAAQDISALVSSQPGSASTPTRVGGGGSARANYCFPSRCAVARGEKPSGVPAKSGTGLLQSNNHEPPAARRECFTAVMSAHEPQQGWAPPPWPTPSSPARHRCCCVSGA